MAVCHGCEALAVLVRRLENEICDLMVANEELEDKLRREIAAGWDLAEGSRVQLGANRVPRPFPMPLFERSKGGAA